MLFLKRIGIGFLFFKHTHFEIDLVSYNLMYLFKNVKDFSIKVIKKSVIVPVFNFLQNN